MGPPSVTGRAPVACPSRAAERRRRAEGAAPVAGRAGGPTSRPSESGTGLVRWRYPRRRRAADGGVPASSASSRLRRPVPGPIWSGAVRSAKMFRLLRRVAGLRHLLTTSSRFPVLASRGPTSRWSARVRTGLRTSVRRETRSARRTVGRRTTRSRTPVLCCGHGVFCRGARHARPRGSAAGREVSSRAEQTHTWGRTGHTRQTKRRTRETYGGTEDPHQAQGL